MLGIATPDAITAADKIVAALDRATASISKLEKTMSAQADALTAEVSHIKDTLAAFLAKFNDAVAQLGSATGDEQAMAEATANLESIIAPIDAIVNPPSPPAPPADQPTT